MSAHSIHRSGLLFALAAIACSGSQTGPTGPVEAPRTDAATIAPPVAEVRPHAVETPHGTRSDPYYWLRDDTRKNEDVLGYLRAENTYTKAQLSGTAELQETLFQEILGRIKQDDSSVPYRYRGYWYYTRYETGQEYPIRARRKGVMTAPEEVILDDNQRAKGHAFYRAGGLRVSPDGKLLAFVEDTVGRNQFVLRIKNLETGALLPDTASNISGSMAWANDNRTLFYVAKDPETLRTHRVYRHVLGTEQASDTLVYEEKDTSFYTGLSKTKSDAYVAIWVNSTVSAEARLIDADKPDSEPQVFFPRERDHLYSFDHLDQRFVIRTNWQAKNYRVMEVADGKQGDRAAWRDLVAHREDAFVHSVAVYRGFMAVSEREGGLRKVRVLPAQGEPFMVEADEPAYTMYLSNTPDPDATRVRYTYTSMTTPFTTYERDIATGERVMLKREPVLGGYDPAGYVTEYLHASARDGTKVPVSLVYKKGLQRDGSAPVLQYGYGSYGATMDPRFSSRLVSLVDRGFVFAVAHIRGSQALGRKWYDDGRLLKKRNTFTDFIDVTEHLVAQKYAARDKVFAMGGSAGGLLMGAIVNLRPDLYRGIIAHVPFVDVVTTMLDSTIPLTSNEFDEWGNPKDKTYYDYMLSYSPYDNVGKQAYPSMLVTTGLWDSQVQYFEPAKWVARLRAHKTDDNLLLLHTNMEAGHGGKSGRFQRLRETARDYAFILHILARPDKRQR